MAFMQHFFVGIKGVIKLCEGLSKFMRGDSFFDIVREG